MIQMCMWNSKSNIVNTLVFIWILGYCLHHVGSTNPHKLVADQRIPASVTKWSFIHEPKRFSITTMRVDHHSESMWYIPSLHDKYSIGWNRTVERGFSTRPYACSLEFFGVGLESTMSGFEGGGTGYLIIQTANGSPLYHGYDKDGNETSKLHCYYTTGKGFGSNFFDTPKTYGLVVLCPVLLDSEIGEYAFRNVMQPGKYCRVMAEKATTSVLHLRPTSYVYSESSSVNQTQEANDEIIATFETSPAVTREVTVKRLFRSDYRTHAVCTVQTFRNEHSGPMLYLFALYYLRLGWSVIIYDRFGNHKEFLVDIMNMSGFYYHPYTVYQLSQPSKYSDEYAKSQGFTTKYYYSMEKNWIKSYGNQQADTADQDMDKTKTYDHARVEYHFMDTMLYLDADEFFFCPQAAQSITAQRNFQQNLLERFVLLGIEEMRYVRLPYSGLAPVGFNNTAENRGSADLTNSTQTCMLNSFATRSELGMFQCWSDASTYDDFPKSADMAGVCPFHYNHWSCDGMRGGGRDWGNRCRCKVGFEMANNLAFKPMLQRCHILHFNDNKYRFQLIRKHGKKRHLPNGVYEHDNGDITKPCPIARLFANPIDGGAKLEKVQDMK